MKKPPVLGWKWVLGIITGLFSYISLAAIGGIIGNRSDSLLLLVWRKLFNDKTLSIDFRLIWQKLFDNEALPIDFRWLIGFFILSLLIIILFSVVLKNRSLAYEKYTTNLLNKLLQLDDNLFHLISHHREDETNQWEEKTLKYILYDLTDLFPFIVQGAIFCPDQDNINFLKMKVSLNISQESIERAIFYIGDEDSPEYVRGIAGHAYVSRQMLKCKFFRSISQGWIPILPRGIYYKYFKSDHIPRHRATVALPILKNEMIFGVVCLDGIEPDTFDSESLQTLLLSITDRIATVLMVDTLKN